MCVALMSSPFTILPFHAFGSVETKSFLPFSISIVRSREMNVPNAHKTFIRMAHILCWKTNVVKRNIFIFYIYLCRRVCARVCRIHYISFGLVEWYFIRFLVLAIFKMQVSMQENCSTHCGQCMKCNLVNICVQTLHENMFTAMCASHTHSHCVWVPSKFHFGGFLCVSVLGEAHTGNDEHVTGNSWQQCDTIKCNASTVTQFFIRHILQITSPIPFDE